MKEKEARNKIKKIIENESGNLGFLIKMLQEGWSKATTASNFVSFVVCFEGKEAQEQTKEIYTK